MIKELIEYIEFVSHAASTIGSKNPDFKYYSYESLILTFGHSFEKSDEPVEEAETGQLGECYQNALQYVMFRHPDFYYCEGFARHSTLVIPVPHAWTIAPDGQVKDPTWPYHDGDYFGVPMTTRYASRHMIDTGYYGVIVNDWLNGNKLLTNGFPEDAIPEKYRKGTR